jgi:hypothetical protein
LADEQQQTDPRGKMKLFGFEIRRASKDRDDVAKLPSIVPPTDNDGAGYVTAGGAHFGHYVNMDGNDSKDNAQLVRQYRTVAQHPEVDDAIENIINEAISAAEDESSVELKMDKSKLPDSIKKKVAAEFENIVAMLNFNEHGHDMFRRWYVDGRIYHHLVVEKGKESKGIVDIRPVDASKIRKVKEVKSKKDAGTGATVVEKVTEYFVFQEKPGMQNSGIKMTVDSVSYVTSGLLDAERKKVVSYLHKSLKAINQLRMMEDSLVIYRLARAPERRIFYIDVGSLPRGKAEQYMKDIMARYRNKIVYDAETGNLKDDRKHMSMLEDFWLPRREGGRGTEIDTLPGGDNLGQIDDIIYFQKKLYKSLNVPVSRLDPESSPFGLGRSTEISRDELKFQKFIDRLRQRFSYLFLGILEKQLVLKKIIVPADWEQLKNDITVNYIRDNYYAELKDTEIWKERFQSLEMVAEHVGTFFSREWVMKEILHMDVDTVKEIMGQMDKEAQENPEETPQYQMGFEAGAEEGKNEQPERAPVQTQPKAAPVTVNIDADGVKKKSKTEGRKSFEDEMAAAEMSLLQEVTNYLKEE